MESYPSHCPFGFSQGTIPTKTNTHTHFKQTEAEPPETLIQKKKIYKKHFGILL